MADRLRVIDRAIDEHHHIREGLKQAGDSVTDIEALFALHKEYAKWSQSSIRELKDKQEHLLEAVGALGQGLKRHFDFEEKALPPLLGDVIMQTILQEHVEIARLIDGAKAALKEGVLEGVGQRELLTQKAEIQADIRQIIEAVEEHAKHEEAILKAIKKALEA
jgi:hemerythrin